MAYEILVLKNQFSDKKCLKCRKFGLLKVQVFLLLQTFFEWPTVAIYQKPWTIIITTTINTTATTALRISIIEMFTFVYKLNPDCNYLVCGTIYVVWSFEEYRLHCVTAGKTVLWAHTALKTENYETLPVLEVKFWEFICKKEQSINLNEQNKIFPLLFKP